MSERVMVSLLLKIISTSSRFFQNQPSEICSRLSEKASKGSFWAPDKAQNPTNEGKGKETN